MKIKLKQSGYDCGDPGCPGYEAISIELDGKEVSLETLLDTLGVSYEVVEEDESE